MLPSMLGAMLMRGEEYSGVPGRGGHLLEGPAWPRLRYGLRRPTRATLIGSDAAQRPARSRQVAPECPAPGVLAQ
jgi:hypothetical protein